MTPRSCTGPSQDSCEAEAGFKLEPADVDRLLQQSADDEQQRLRAEEQRKVRRAVLLDPETGEWGFEEQEIAQQTHGNVRVRPVGIADGSHSHEEKCRACGSMIACSSILTGSKKRKPGSSMYLCVGCRPDFLIEGNEIHRSPRSDSFYKKKTPRAELTGVRHVPKWCKPTFDNGRTIAKSHKRGGKGRRKNRAKK